MRNGNPRKVFGAVLRHIHLFQKRNQHLYCGLFYRGDGRPRQCHKYCIQQGIQCHIDRQRNPLFPITTMDGFAKNPIRFRDFFEQRARLLFYRGRDRWEQFHSKVCRHQVRQPAFRPQKTRSNHFFLNLFNFQDHETFSISRTSVRLRPFASLLRN